MNHQLTAYRHPTLTVLVDDSHTFLECLMFHLNPLWPRKAFQDAQSAIDWLQNAYRITSGLRTESIQVGHDEVTDSFERRNAMIDIEQIYHSVKNPYRFSLPSVLVIDYFMPSMTGLEFCSAISHLPCKKILLTGKADGQTVIDAFNSKLINCYIKKEDANVMGRLETEVSRLQNEFFFEQTNTLTDLLSRHSYSFLTDPAITQLADQLCSRYHFVEYYLFPNPTGILFFDANGKSTLMVIETRAGLTTQLEMAQDQGAPQELLRALSEFRLLPFFCDSGGVYRSEIGDDWLSYCLPPQICHGREDYFWGLFELPSRYLPGPIYSFKEFCQSMAL